MLTQSFHQLASAAGQEFAPQTFSVSLRESVSDPVSANTQLELSSLSGKISITSESQQVPDTSINHNNPISISPSDTSAELGAEASTDPAPLVPLVFDFPLEALSSSEPGWVKLRFFVASDGAVKFIVAIDQFPDHRYNDSAIAGILRSRFAPAVSKGEKISAWVEMTVHFDFIEEEDKKNQSSSGINPSQL